MTIDEKGAVSRGYELGRWSLSELLPGPSEEVISSRLAELDQAVQEFEALRHDLGPQTTQAGLIEILRRYESLAERMTVLGAYAALWFAEDTQCSEALAFQNRMNQHLTEVSNRTLFFTLWWKALDEERVSELLPEGSDLADYRHYLLDLRRFRPHTLDEPREQIIQLKDANGIRAVLTLYSMLTNRLQFHIEVDGESQKLTRDAIASYAYSPRAELREAAYKELYRVYGNEASLLAQMYVNRVKDWHSENVVLRSFSTPIAVRNLANDIPDEAVATLLEVVRERAPLFQRYFRQKAAWLGIERLRRYDLYAPLTASERQVPFGQAVNLVLETFRGFDPDLAHKAERVFAERHIDSENRSGKKGGAFCASVLPRRTPWLLVNYTGRVRDVATLAHELGHALHSMLAADHSILTHQASLPLAETASVFSEMLVTDRLLQEESDPLARRELLAAAVDDIYATVVRQAFFVLFELSAHQALLDNRTVDELHSLYQQNLAEQFGDSMEIGEEFRFEWLSIPHIYSTPFYCYAYCFGQLLSLALYRRYRNEGDAFKPSYLRLLAHGGSAPPERILREAGLDLRDRAFWESGFSVAEEMISELEA